METKKLTFKNYNVNYMQLKETKQQLCLSVVIIFLTNKKKNIEIIIKNLAIYMSYLSIL